ncbi:alpha/beta hydrolase [Sulfuriflexus mobilis]|uniref:alpha/beta hydrolase n=1 Tax=Sulfuriflexus mobilis TaxID=1811807 RepID=UPI0018D5645A|nr:alpha/beta hydrolase [Sulfuriflexus mobilis]
MKDKMINIIASVLLVLLLVNVWMYFQQPAMTFYPYRQFYQTPSDWGLAYEDVSLTTPDGTRLHGWYLPREGAQRALLFMHGNGGNISHRGDSLAIFHRLGFNIFIFDYRGYGRSEGVPGEQGLYEDAAAAWQYLVEQRGFAGEDIVLFGRSLGASVAAKLAAEVGPAGLILESSFSSARDMAQSVLPLLSRLVVMRYRFDTAAYVRRVTCPVLVAHSPDDDIIPFELGQAVYAAANQPKIFLTMQGDHNSGFLQSQPAYEQGLAEFMSSRVFGVQEGVTKNN